MKALTKVRTGLITAAAVVLLNVLALVGALYERAIGSFGIGLLFTCLFIAYIRGLLRRDLRQVRRAYRAYLVVWLLCLAFMVLLLPGVIRDMRQRYNATYWESAGVLLFWLGSLCFSAVLVGLLRLGATGLSSMIERQDGSPWTERRE